MEELHSVVKNMLFELSQETVDSASRKAAQRNLDLLAFTKDGVATRTMGNGYEFDDDKFEKYIKTVENPKRRERLIRMYSDGTLGDYLLRQQHYFATMSNSKIEWLRDNTDVPISPEFYEGIEIKKSASERKPTKEEHDFYKYMTSMGQDIDGIPHDDLVRYREAFCRLYDEAMGIKDIWNMIPEIS